MKSGPIKRHGWLAPAVFAKINEPAGCYQHRMPALTKPAFEERAMAEQQPILAQAAPPLNEFRDIPGFPGYRAGSDGTVWSCLKPTGSHWKGDSRQVPSEHWKLLKPDCRKEDGRARHTLRNSDGQLTRKYRSHFVLLAFTGPCPEGMEACHDDGNCLNDASGNLRWDTSTANKADMLRHGTRPQGESHPSAKLNDAEILSAIRLRAKGLTFNQIGDRLGVTAARIHQICKKGTR